MNKQNVTIFDAAASQVHPDFLSNIEKLLKPEFTVYRHDHDSSFSMLKIHVKKPETHQFSHIVHLFHDKETGLIEAVHTSTGSKENSGDYAHAKHGDNSDLAMGLSCFLGLHKDSRLCKSLENMVYDRPRAVISENTVLPSQKFEKFVTKRSGIVPPHAA